MDLNVFPTMLLMNELTVALLIISNKVNCCKLSDEMSCMPCVQLISPINQPTLFLTSPRGAERKEKIPQFSDSPNSLAAGSYFVFFSAHALVFNIGARR